MDHSFLLIHLREPPTVLRPSDTHSDQESIILQVDDTYFVKDLYKSETWSLSLAIMKKLLLLMFKKSKPQENGVLKKQIAYAFGGHYFELKILDLLTGM